MRKLLGYISRFAMEAIFVASVVLIVISLVRPRLFKADEGDSAYRDAMYVRISEGAKTLDSLRGVIDRVDSSRSKNRESITIINNKYETYRSIIASADNSKHIGILADNINGIRPDKRDSVWSGYVGRDTNELR